MAVTSIKEAAEANDEKLFYEINHLDLIAKEFKYHDFCYREFTRKKPVQSQTSIETLQGNFDAVIRCIEERILSQNQAISITVLHDLYGVHVQDIEVSLRWLDTVFLKKCKFTI